MQLLTFIRALPASTKPSTSRSNLSFGFQSPVALLRNGKQMLKLENTVVCEAPALNEYQKKSKGRWAEWSRALRGRTGL